MVNPQAEDGHIDINHVNAEQFGLTSISGGEWQILWVVLRKTWGWHKKEDAISLTQFQKLTGLSRRSVCKAISKLVSKSILLVNKDRYITLYRFNKLFFNETSVQKVTSIPKRKGSAQKYTKTSAQKYTRVVPKSIPKLVPKSIHTKEKKETITKETIQKKEARFSKIGDIDINTLQEIATTYKVPLAFVESKYDDLKNYCLAKGKTYRNYKAALMKWVKEDALKVIEKHHDKQRYSNKYKVTKL